MSFIGRQINIGLAKEAVRGTSVAPTFWLPAITKGVDDVAQLAKDGASRGVIETDFAAEVAKRWAEGDVEGFVRSEAFGLILLSLLGAVATSTDTPEAGVHTHDFTVAQNVQHPSLTLTMEHPAADVAFALAMITQLELNVELGEFVKYTVGFMGKQSASATSTVAYTTENEFVAQHANIYFAANLAGLGAATALKAKSVTLTINKNLESDDVIGTVDPNDFLNRQFQVEATVELYYDNNTHKDIYVAGTEQAMRIELINTDVTIGAASNPTMVIDLAKVVTEEWARTSDADDIIRQTLNIQAYYSTADSKMVTVQLVNVHDGTNY